jgi:pimeloyl-ACP methyl ester carboxylesterase
MQELLIKSSLDGSLEPSLFEPAEEKNRPLLVGLHTWSCDRFNQVDEMLPFAKKRGFSLLLPEFRGPNTPENPRCREACGSLLAKQDIVDAVSYICDRYPVDRSSILLLGASGGGHMALLMAAYAPALWKAVAAFVPVVSLEDWYFEKLGNKVGGKYAADIAACCGGPPSEETASEYAFRSPIFYAAEIARSNTKIFCGKSDPSIPCHHGFDIYEKIFRGYPDARVYFDMFDGVHELRLGLAEDWFDSQLNKNISAEVSG